MKNKLKNPLIHLWTLLPFIVILNGQSNVSDESGDVYELSPFVVDTRSDEGYYATNTLAGTRLNSSLKDVSSPISVFTLELMEDVGATNMQEALMYSVSVQNENEYAPDDTEGESIASTTQTRVRGISAGTTTRGYFKSNFRSDTYNIERLTIARGPNSILFGLGSPSGVLDSTPVKAYFGDKRGRVSLRLDNWGSIRGTVDYNLPVIEDLVPVRVAGMTQENKTFRDPENDDETRYYVTSTIKPFENTTIRVSYEKMKNDRIRARQSLMEDRISDWIAAGEPLYDHSTGLWTLDNGASWQEISSLSNFVNNSGIGYQDRVHIVNGSLGGAELQGLVWQNTGLSFNPTADPKYTFSDGSIVPSDINYHGLASVSRLEGDISSIILEQKIVDDFFVEIAYNNENYTRDQDEALRGGLTGIEADVNYYLPYAEGSDELVMNPNRGRYMVESEYLGYTQEIQLETFRAMASYSVDFSDKEWSWLGRHNFGLMYQKEITDNFKIKRRQMNVGDYWIGGEGDFNINNIKSRYYLDIPGLSSDSAGVEYPTEFKQAPWDSVIGSVQGDGIPTQTRNEIVGKLFVLQSFLLDDSLVLTYGYRSDTQKAYTSTFGERDPVTREFIYEGVGLNDEANEQSGVTRTYGLVYHTPLEGVSLVYNKANTFNPQGDYFDWFGNPLPPGSGEGEDYGVNLELLDGKLNAKITYFKNTSIDNVEFDWYYEEPKWSVVGNMDASWGMVSVYADRLGNTEDINIVNVNDSIRATRDYESKGFEMELFYQPTTNLDIRFTLSKTEAVNLKVVPYLQEYVAERYPIWEKYFGYPSWGQWDWPLPEWNDDWANTPGTTGYDLLNPLAALPRVDEFAASEGSVTARGRKWRSNLIVNYRVESVQGLSVGGAVRYRSPDTIGYGGRDNPRNPGTQITDVDKPIEGEKILEFDGWVKYRKNFVINGKDLGWTVQMNIQNLLDDDDFVATSVDTFGRPTSYIQKTPRTFVLTNTIEF